MIGISSPDFSVMPFSTAADMIKPHFKLWEIVSEADHFLPDIKDQLKVFIETSDVKIQIHAPYSDINPAAFDSKACLYALETFSEIMFIASDLGIEIMTIHPGKIGSIQSYDTSRVLKYTRECLEFLDRQASELSVTLALENMPVMRGTVCTTAKELEELIDSLDIKVCFDVGHAHIAGQTDEILQLKDKFANVHLHDNEGDKDKHMELGKGTVDLPKIARELAGYGGNLVIENRTRDVEVALRSKTYMESLMD